MDERDRIPCIFCGQTTAKISREDVFPKWIFEWARRRHGIKNVRHKTSGLWIGTKSKTGSTIKAAGTGGVLVRGPCKPCNETWMSALESQTMPILTPLFEGHHVELSKSEQSSIALWLVKTSMFYEAAYVDDGQRYFTPANFRTLYGNRDKAPFFAVPPYTNVYLANYIDKHMLIKPRFYPFEISGQTVVGSRVDLAGFSSTFAIGRLAMQLLTHRPPPPHNAVDTPRTVRDWSKFDVKCFPPTGAIHFPPGKHLKGDAFERYANRWLDGG